MEDKKLCGRLCPKCKEPYQTINIAKTSLGAGVQVNMLCENNHKWSEFYGLTYQGFWWAGKRYNSFGEEQTNDGQGSN